PMRTEGLLFDMEDSFPQKRATGMIGHSHAIRALRDYKITGQLFQRKNEKSFSRLDKNTHFTAPEAVRAAHAAQRSKRLSRDLLRCAACAARMIAQHLLQRAAHVLAIPCAWATTTKASAFQSCEYEGGISWRK